LVPQYVPGILEPIQLPATFLTFTEPVETHASNQGGNSDDNAKITPLSEVTWMIFGMLTPTNVH
jgi:hypothetical protein